MDLAQELAGQIERFRRDAPPERVALYERMGRQLAESFARDEVPGVGDAAPDFTLPRADGKPFSLSEALSEGPVVVAFYRGGWCPYCNIQLRAYQRALPQFHALGARLVAISPQTPDASLSTQEKGALAFDVLSDVGSHVARRFGLAYVLAPELQEAMRANGLSLPEFNGDDSWELPVTGTFVIARDGKIALSYVDTDYRHRLSPETILAALKEMGAPRG